MDSKVRNVVDWPIWSFLMKDLDGRLLGPLGAVLGVLEALNVLLHLGPVVIDTRTLAFEKKDINS